MILTCREWSCIECSLYQTWVYRYNNVVETPWTGHTMCTDCDFTHYHCISLVWTLYMCRGFDFTPSINVQGNPSFGTPWNFDKQDTIIILLRQNSLKSRHLSYTLYSISACVILLCTCKSDINIQFYFNLIPCRLAMQTTLEIMWKLNAFLVCIICSYVQFIMIIVGVIVFVIVYIFTDAFQKKY